jgi:hypothetical protein
VEPDQLKDWHRAAARPHTHFTTAGVAATVIEDLVSRKWLAHIVSGEETSTQVQLVFTDALELEGLMDDVLARIDRPTVGPSPTRPLMTNTARSCSRCRTTARR